MKAVQEMEIAVCIKQVPDAPTIRIDEHRMTVIRDGVESMINPLDRVALEAALCLKAGGGAGVHVLTMGPEQSEAVLREALALGADRATLLSDPAFAGADTLATSQVLARAISRLVPSPDLILCGTHTVDSDTGHVGPQLAEALGIPQVCGAHGIEWKDREFLVERLSDGFRETFRILPPVLLTLTSRYGSPRELGLAALEAAFSPGTKILREDCLSLGLNPQEVGFGGSATRVRALRQPTSRRRGEVIRGTPREVAEALIARLASLNVLEETRGIL